MNLVLLVTSMPMRCQSDISIHNAAKKVDCTLIRLVTCIIFQCVSSSIVFVITKATSPIEMPHNAVSTHLPTAASSAEKPYRLSSCVHVIAHWQ